MSKPDVVDEYEGLQREREEERVEALREGLRLIEKYGFRWPISEDTFNTPGELDQRKTLAAVAVAVMFSDEGYEATEEPVVRYEPHMLGGEVWMDDGGNEVLIVGVVRASIKGYKR